MVVFLGSALAGFFFVDEVAAVLGLAGAFGAGFFSVLAEAFFAAAAGFLAGSVFACRDSVSALASTTFSTFLTGSFFNELGTANLLHEQDGYSSGGGRS